jgi:hypothetical protein
MFALLALYESSRNLETKCVFRGKGGHEEQC